MHFVQPELQTTGIDRWTEMHLSIDLTSWLDSSVLDICKFKRLNKQKQQEIIVLYQAAESFCFPTFRPPNPMEYRSRATFFSRYTQAFSSI